MPTNEPFEQSLKIGGDRIPEDIRAASTYVNDTLEICWASAQQVFRDKATPEVALAIYDRICARVTPAGRMKGAAQ